MIGVVRKSENSDVYIIVYGLDSDKSSYKSYAYLSIVGDQQQIASVLVGEAMEFKVKNGYIAVLDLKGTVEEKRNLKIDSILYNDWLSKLRSIKI